MKNIFKSLANLLDDVVDFLPSHVLSKDWTDVISNILRENFWKVLGRG